MNPQDENNASQKSADENRRPIRTPIWPTEFQGTSRRWKKRAPCEGHRHTTAAGLTPSTRRPNSASARWGSSAAFQTLLKVNQKDGFDCPSCAWPDPDGKRKMAEFCENGAKAVAYEATTKRLTPEVFARHPISELLKHRDIGLDEHRAALRIR